MNKLLFYWRIFILTILLILLVTKLISLNTFIVLIVGLIVFVGIPEAIKAMRNKTKDS